MAGSMYGTNGPNRTPLTTPGVGEPTGKPAHPYVSSTAGKGTAPNPQLPEARPGTVPQGGPPTPKGSPPNPTK